MTTSPIDKAAQHTPAHLARRMRGLSDRTIAWIFVAPTIFLPRAPAATRPMVSRAELRPPPRWSRRPYLLW